MSERGGVGLCCSYYRLSCSVPLFVFGVGGGGGVWCGVLLRLLEHM